MEYTFEHVNALSSDKCQDKYGKQDSPDDSDGVTEQNATDMASTVIRTNGKLDSGGSVTMYMVN